MSAQSISAIIVSASYVVAESVAATQEPIELDRIFHELHLAFDRVLTARGHTKEEIAALLSLAPRTFFRRLRLARDHVSAQPEVQATLLARVVASQSIRRSELIELADSTLKGRYSRELIDSELSVLVTTAQVFAGGSGAEAIIVAGPASHSPEKDTALRSSVEHFVSLNGPISTKDLAEQLRLEPVLVAAHLGSLLAEDRVQLESGPDERWIVQTDYDPTGKADAKQHALIRNQQLVSDLLRRVVARPSDDRVADYVTPHFYRRRIEIPSTESSEIRRLAEDLQQAVDAVIERASEHVSSPLDPGDKIGELALVIGLAGIEKP